MPLMSINGDNYPETLANMIIINAPPMFDGAFSVVKRLLSPETQKKIQARPLNAPTPRPYPPSLRMTALPHLCPDGPSPQPAHGPQHAP